MGPVSIGVEVQRNTDGDTPSTSETDIELKLHSGPHQKQFGGTYCHRENLRRATEKVIEGPEVCSRTKVSNMAYNFCLCRFQASMLKTTVETVCTYKHLNMPTIV